MARVHKKRSDRPSALFDPDSSLVPEGPSRASSHLQRALNKVSTSAALAALITGFINQRGKPAYDLCEPVVLNVKPRVMPRSGVQWVAEPFNGGEVFHLDSAYVLDGDVYITARPPLGKLSFVRFTFGQGIDLLNGFSDQFETFLEETDGGGMGPEVLAAFKRAQVEALERACLDSGNHPDFGSW